MFSKFFQLKDIHIRDIIDFFTDGNVGSPYVGKLKSTRKSRQVRVSISKTSEFVNDNDILKVDVLELDAEGAEFDIMNSREIFVKFRPRILLEPLHSKEHKKLILLFERLGCVDLSVEQPGTRHPLALFLP